LSSSEVEVVSSPRLRRSVRISDQQANAGKRRIWQFGSLGRADGAVYRGLIYGGEMPYGAEQEYDPDRNGSRRNDDLKSSLLLGYSEFWVIANLALTYKMPPSAESGN
jgi:hypothetical protein